MRTPAMLGDLLPVAVPGFLVVGALSVLIMATPLGPLAFNGPIVFLIVGLLVGVLVIGYVLAGAQEAIAKRSGRWALPPASHLDWGEHAVMVPAPALERAGYRCREGGVAVPLGVAYALERALAGAWGTPEGAGWDRVAYLQRITLAFAVSTVLAAAFILGAVIATGGLDAGMRGHGLSVLVLGALGTVLVGYKVTVARRESIIDLFADARALIKDRGENAEVRRVFHELDLELSEEDVGFSVPA